MKDIIAGVLSTLFVSSASAAAVATAPAPLPEPHTRGEITWVTGGIGKDEAGAMKREAAAYPLELVFVQKAGSRGEYLADVPVTIRDAHHRVVFEGRSEGPMFLARLPAGDYLVTAHWQDWNFTRHVRLGEKHQRVVFEWKEAPRSVRG